MYQVKITLQDVTPTIWRCILVDESITLHKLNHMIQAAMGWTNSHLHEFDIAGQRYGVPSDEEFDADMKDDKKYIVANVLKKGGKCLYTYDFGDSWSHVIKVEDVAPSFGKAAAPACIDGARRCPPEDCGGAYGYEELLDVVTNPKHADYESLREWLGDADDAEPYDAEEFSKEKATRRMRSNLWQSMEY